MNNTRSLNDNERIDEAISALGSIISALEETKLGKKSLMRCCRDHGLDGLRVRRLIDSVLKVTAEEKDSEPFDIKEPYEELYKEILGISDPADNVRIPYDYRESLDHVMKEYLSEKEILVLTKRFGLDGGGQMTWEETQEAAGLGQGYARIYASNAIRKLRIGKNLRILASGLSAYLLEEETKTRLHEIEIDSLRKKYEVVREAVVKDAQEELDAVKAGEEKKFIADRCRAILPRHMGLDPRSQKALEYHAKRFGTLKNLYDILLSGDDDLKKVRNMGNGTIAAFKEETESFVMKEFGMTTDKLRKTLLSCGEYSVLCGQISIDRIGLGTRHLNALKRADSIRHDTPHVMTLRDLMLTTDSELLRFRNISKNSIKKIREDTDRFITETFGITEIELRAAIESEKNSVPEGKEDSNARL